MPAGRIVRVARRDCQCRYDPEGPAARARMLRVNLDARWHEDVRPSLLVESRFGPARRLRSIFACFEGKDGRSDDLLTRCFEGSLKVGRSNDLLNYLITYSITARVT